MLPYNALSQTTTNGPSVQRLNSSNEVRRVTFTLNSDLKKAQPNLICFDLVRETQRSEANLECLPTCLPAGGRRRGEALAVLEYFSLNWNEEISSSRTNGKHRPTTRGRRMRRPRPRTLEAVSNADGDKRSVESVVGAGMDGWFACSSVAPNE